RARRRSLQAGDEPHGRRFAAPGWTEESEELALADFQVHVVDCGHVPVAFRQVPQANVSHMGSLPPFPAPPLSSGPWIETVRRAGKIVASALLVVGRSALAAPPGPRPHTVRLVMATETILLFSPRVRHHPAPSGAAASRTVATLACPGTTQTTRPRHNPNPPQSEPATTRTGYNPNRLRKYSRLRRASARVSISGWTTRSCSTTSQPL